MIKAYKDFNLAQQAAQACPCHTALSRTALSRTALSRTADSLRETLSNKGNRCSNFRTS